VNLVRGARVLRNRYELIERVHRNSDNDESAGTAQTWLARGLADYGSEYLLRLWPHREDDSGTADMNRALWDAELRTLYRACSSPGAERFLMVMKEAGIDREAGFLVMVLEAPGYTCLADELGQRRVAYPWLAQEESEARRDLWEGLRGLAAGLYLLHEQQVLHTGVSAENVYFDPAQGAESLRLGGFEWSMRVGAASIRPFAMHWGTPPESSFSAQQVFGPDGDWYGFGILAARCLLSIEHLNNNSPSPHDLHKHVLTNIEKSRNILTEAERDLLLRLVAREPIERMTRYEDIAAAMDDIIVRLGTLAAPSEWDDRYLLMIDPGNTGVVDAAMSAGLRNELRLDTAEMFNPRSDRHVDALRGFIERDLNRQGARLYLVPNQQFFLLVGDQLQLRIGPYRNIRAGDTEATWRHARVIGCGELRGAADNTTTVFSVNSIIVLNIKQDLARTEPTLLRNAAGWDRRLPRIDKVAKQRAELDRFCAFVRVTNQIELLLRDAELFRYQIVERGDTDDGLEEIVIEETDRGREPLSFLQVDGGMVEFLQRERENTLKTDGGTVLLTEGSHDSLTTPSEGVATTWSVVRVDVTAKRATLHRLKVDSGTETAPDEGVLRSAGMDGQIKLIRRRKDAIDRMRRHTYLLRSLANPGEVYMDTGLADLPVRLNPEKVDASKRAVIQDVLRVRPIYALQGPPGTGKTTMVAWLLRQILTEDPVAQILITAQAHSAVDVLWSKVKQEAFKGVSEDRQPLAVRLGRKPPPGTPNEEGSVEVVVSQILDSTVTRLDRLPERDQLQDEWLRTCRTMQAENTAPQPGGVLPDFKQLVKRSANLTFCTTSAGELEGLSSELSFDWSIVEESGKVHGFDLALPLQAGHRWLLIGDQKQLPPYRLREYTDAVTNLERVVDALGRLPGRAAGLLDGEFVRMWHEWGTEQRAEFIAYSSKWIKVFEKIFKNCENALGDPANEPPELDTDAGQPPHESDESHEPGDREEFVSEAVMAGMLRVQHRMHPTIGTLISETFYRGRLKNAKTSASRADPDSWHLLHPFTAPEGIQDKSIVWLDMPWSPAGEGAGEWGGPSGGKGVPRFINPAEAYALSRFINSLQSDRSTAEQKLKLTVLSPYSQQVGYLARRLPSLSLPGDIELARRARRAAGNPLSGTFTVDSFQGDQSDIIAVSLVRNNKNQERDRAKLIGFLLDASRLNVLLSRAERLLILVGSWEFFHYCTEFVDLDQASKELWPWKKALTMLGTWEKEGHMLRVPADLRGYVPPTVESVLGSRRREGRR